MLKILKRLLLVAPLALAMGCSSDDSFDIEARIEGLGAQSVTLTYTADGAVHQTVWQPNSKGLIRMKGASAAYTLADIALTSDGRSLAMLPVRSGQHIKVSFPLTDPVQITASGSKTVELMSRFIRDNAAAVKGDGKKLNSAIARFVREHPADVASTALLATLFDMDGSAPQADSLFNSITPDARPLTMVQNFNAALAGRTESSLHTSLLSFTAVNSRGDSLYTFSPRDRRRWLLVFTGREAAETGSPDTVSPILKRILAGRTSTRELGVVQLSLIPDSSRWRRSLSRDTVGWTRAWLPGAGANATVMRMQVTRTPYFIVVDSTGRQKLRTSSAQAAAAFLAR